MSFFNKLKNSSHIFKKSPKTKSAEIASSQHDHSHGRVLVIYHIDPETEGTFSFTANNHDTGENIVERVCNYYNVFDYKEYFGLKYAFVDEKNDHEFFWLDPVKPIGKQLKYSNNVLTFRIKHFPAKPVLIESEYVRYLVFLQLRNYLLRGDIQLALTEEVQLAAYATQAVLGDYDPSIHGPNYLKDLKFLSPKIIADAQEMIIESHKNLESKTPAEMELLFLGKASLLNTYGAEMIRVRNNKDVPINFGVSHKGIITYLHELPVNTVKIELYPWTQVGKISYDNKILKINVLTPNNKNSEIFKKNVMIFKCNSSRICKHLWKFILDQRSFYNFKRGADVPTIKSSSSLFSRKSKFRFTGRCETELINSQVNGLKTPSSDVKTSIKYATLPAGSSISFNNQEHEDAAFKRRSYISSKTIKNFVDDTIETQISETTLNNLKPDENGSTNLDKNTTEETNSHTDETIANEHEQKVENIDADLQSKEEEPRLETNSIFFDINENNETNDSKPSDTLDETKLSKADFNNNQVLLCTDPSSNDLKHAFYSSLDTISETETPNGNVNRNPSLTNATNGKLTKKDEKSLIHTLKAFYLNFVEFIQSLSSNNLALILILMTIVFFFIVWFVDKKCVAYGCTNRLCSFNGQLKRFLSRRNDEFKRWPVGSNLSSIKFTTIMRDNEIRYKTSTDPLFLWFFQHYD